MSTGTTEAAEMRWAKSWRADPFVASMADRHYSRKTKGAAQFSPPGRVVVLRAEQAAWVSLWPQAQFVDHDWPDAWLCTLFRNEGPLLSSVLIRQAVAATRHEWPDPPRNGMVTFVNPAKIRAKRDPGYCFLAAGFQRVGTTKSGLLVLQLLPSAMPEPAIPLGASQRLLEVSGL